MKFDEGLDRSAHIDGSRTETPLQLDPIQEGEELASEQGRVDGGAQLILAREALERFGDRAMDAYSASVEMVVGGMIGCRSLGS
ncbi:hypothetical protein RS82_02916 [Microbacterium trichothecenolyticum]|uniref:Uncharacterized protein n=1 Tax=Microbacterium trichothecenolyticum TaxID=69370 RepID=A0A0M2H5R9_MICTR|nr:hypothetical protein RS82_02916 [Microbacterium trichothecenolyticum]